MDTNDLRASGDATMVRIELDGRWRWVFVTREAIESHLMLGPSAIGKMTADERCDWVREHLADVFEATRKKLIDPHDVGNIVLTVADL